MNLDPRWDAAHQAEYFEQLPGWVVMGLLILLLGWWAWQEWRAR